MIITLLVWLFKKYLMPVIKTTDFKTKYFPVPRKISLIAIIIFSCLNGVAQEKSFSYNVIHKGGVIGRMQLQQKHLGADLFLKLTSEVKMRFLMSVKVNVDESAHFQNGKLISSHVYRKVNDKEKANRQTKLQVDRYQTTAEGKSGVINHQSINYNLMLLYVKEPVHNETVYSDNFQQFFKVKKTDDHVYRLDLPDGNYNDYTYRNGVCSKVEIHHRLYSILIALT